MITQKTKEQKRIDELERVCAELYQVIGCLSGKHDDCFDHPDVQRALDNASRARLVHRRLLPWPREPLPGYEFSATPRSRLLSSRSIR